MGIRRKSRETVVQTLYALEYKDDYQYENYKDCLKDILKDKSIDLEGKISEFAVSILSIVIENLQVVDSLIKKHSTNWELDRLAKIDKSILRIAVSELLYTETASAIIMNEAIEISKKFSSDNSGKFINGVLNSITEEIRVDKND